MQSVIYLQQALAQDKIVKPYFHSHTSIKTDANFSIIMRTNCMKKEMATSPGDSDFEFPCQSFSFHALQLRDHLWIRKKKKPKPKASEIFVRPKGEKTRHRRKILSCWAQTTTFRK